MLWSPLTASKRTEETSRKNGENDPSLGPCKGTVGGAAGGSGNWGKSNSNALKIPFFTSFKPKWAEPMANLEKVQWARYQGKR